MQIVKATTSVRTQKQIEKMTAQIAQLEANQDYIAMMTDVELETEETEESEVE